MPQRFANLRRGLKLGTQGLAQAGGLSAPGARCPRPIAQGGGMAEALGSGTIIFCSMRMPPTPSTMEWCIFMYSAKRPFSKPSMTCASHSGRLKSMGCECRRETSTPSSRSPPGLGSAEWRR